MEFPKTLENSKKTHEINQSFKNKARSNETFRNWTKLFQKLTKFRWKFKIPAPPWRIFSDTDAQLWKISSIVLQKFPTLAQFFFTFTIQKTCRHHKTKVVNENPLENNHHLKNPIAYVVIKREIVIKWFSPKIKKKNYPHQIINEKRHKKNIFCIHSL